MITEVFTNHYLYRIRMRSALVIVSFAEVIFKWFNIKLNGVWRMIFHNSSKYQDDERGDYLPLSTESPEKPIFESYTHLAFPPPKLSLLE